MFFNSRQESTIHRFFNIIKRRTIVFENQNRRFPCVKSFGVDSFKIHLYQAIDFPNVREFLAPILSVRQSGSSDGVKMYVCVPVCVYIQFLLSAINLIMEAKASNSEYLLGSVFYPPWPFSPSHVLQIGKEETFPSPIHYICMQGFKGSPTFYPT